MAKADDTSSTIDWISLREAMDLAAERLWSKELAKKRLVELLAAGKVPWSCMSWKGLDAKSLAEMRREGRDSKGATVVNLPPAAHCPGDPGFWNSKLKIDWEDNGAHEVCSCGAEALGIRVSRKHLLALLPEEPRKRAEAPRQIEPAERYSIAPKDWLSVVRKDQPRQENEPLVAYANRLLALMQEANVAKVWSFKTLLRRLHDK